MKTRTCFNFDLLFGDYMAKCSDQAKLYYIKLCFFANCGFVANPLSVLDSMGYDKSILDELLNAGELLKLPDRAEVFITSYFVHNKFDPSCWTHTPYYPYWKGKLWTKKNGVATFKKPEEDSDIQLKSNAKETNFDFESQNNEPKHRNLPEGMTEETTFQEWYGVKHWDDLTPKQKKEWQQIWCCD